MKIALTPAPVTPDLAGFPLGEVDYLLLNRVEAAELTAQRGASDDVLAQALADRFPKTAIVLTLGEKGAFTGWQRGFFRPRFPKGVDTRGRRYLRRLFGWRSDARVSVGRRCVLQPCRCNFGD
jgi:sugar/nucleoside kinase (ribokinase family)